MGNKLQQGTAKTILSLRWLF